MQMELGTVRVVTDSREDLLAVLQGMVRHLSNKEVAALLGVSERTVRRWKTSGRLPSRGSEPILLADLLAYLLNNAPAEALDSVLPANARAETLPADGVHSLLRDSEADRAPLDASSHGALREAAQAKHPAAA